MIKVQDATIFWVTLGGRGMPTEFWFGNVL